MKWLFFLPLLVLGVHAGPSYTQCYTGPSQSGFYIYFDNYVPDLYDYDFDNVIESVTVTGMWVYYDNYDYNLSPGYVYFVHGIDVSVTFPQDYRDITSSLRYVGSPTELNADTITFYEGTAFTASEYYAVSDTATFGPLAGKVSSFVITGLSPWTVYIGENYSGSSWCVYANTDHDVGTSGETLDLGIYSSIESIGIADNNILSVRKGCWTKHVAEAAKMKVDGSMRNGAWGRLV